MALQESARPAGAGRRLLSLVGWAGPARVGAMAPGALLGPKLPGLPGRVADQNRTPRTGSPEDRAEQKPNTLYPGMQMTPPEAATARGWQPLPLSRLAWETPAPVGSSWLRLGVGGAGASRLVSPQSNRAPGPLPVHPNPAVPSRPPSHGKAGAPPW